MSKSKWDTSFLRFIIQHLRVPELNYPFELSSDASVERQRQSKKLMTACDLNVDQQKETVVELLHAELENKGGHNVANNLAFLVDRIFDVWLRKNNFDPLLVTHFSHFRFLIYKYLLTLYGTSLDSNAAKKGELGIDHFLLILDSMGKFASIWSPIPKRSQSILLDQIDSFRDAILGNETLNADVISDSFAKWTAFLEKHNDKVVKLNQRLLISEAKKNKSEFCLWLAHHYLNVLFNKRSLPAQLQGFIQSYWIYVVAKEIEAKLPDTLSIKEAVVLANYHPEFDQLCKNIVRVYCHHSQSGFDLADKLLDELQLVSEPIPLATAVFNNDSAAIPTPFFSKEEMWSTMSDCLLAVLQGQLEETPEIFRPLNLPEHLALRYGTSDQFRQECQSQESPPLKEWWLFEDEHGKQVIQAIGLFDQSQQILCSNYLGMKVAQFSFAEFQDQLTSKKISKLASKTTFTNVFVQALNGLYKIADNQKQARLAAAEKAKAEAERLLEDRRLAEEQSQLRAQEIAQRTQQLLAKRADKLRLEKEAAILETIKAFKLGAWIALKHDGESQRFKLVVKIAATGKYVFVDRLGVKRKEFLQQDLLESIQNEEITILSDGAEFEDSLQRVVSRLRISK